MMNGSELGLIFGVALVALGITVPPPHFAGGLLIAFGFAYGIRAMRQTEGQKGLGITLFIGAMIAILASILHGVTKDVWLWGSMSVQAQMGFAGALSQSVAEGVIKFGRGLSDKIGGAADAINLPKGDNK